MALRINMADMTPAREAARFFYPAVRKMTIRVGEQEYQGGMDISFDDRGGMTLSIPSFPAPKVPRSKPFEIK